MTLTAGDIFQKICDRYTVSDGWLVMGEVTPPLVERAEKARRFDAIAITLWPSSGLYVHGFEIKVTKADWRNEKAKPSKSAALMRWCDGYSLVCPPDVAGVEDLLPGWGLIHATEEGLRKKLDPPKLDPVERGVGFMRCMLLRQAQRTPRTPEDIAKARQAGFTEGFEAGKRDAGYENESNKRALESLRQSIDAFEKAAGFQIARGWNGAPQTGAAVRLLQRHGVEGLANRLGSAAEAANDIGELAKSLRALLAEPETAP